MDRGARKVDCIHETGLLGSMRWWYEAMVRGLGGEVALKKTNLNSVTIILNSNKKRRYDEYGKDYYS